MVDREEEMDGTCTVCGAKVGVVVGFIGMGVEYMKVIPHQCMRSVDEIKKRLEYLKERNTLAVESVSERELKWVLGEELYDKSYEEWLKKRSG